MSRRCRLAKVCHPVCPHFANLALHSDFATNGDSPSVDTMDPMQPQYTNSLTFDRGLPSPASASTSWQPTKSGAPHMTLQSDIIDNRRGLVEHNFGQITPPNDTDPEKEARRREIEASEAAAVEASNAKSERARNAANTRHARKNALRKDSCTTNGDSAEAGEESEGKGKREKYREKNRLAAAKCRAKKKNNTEDLETQARTIQARNRQLKEEELNLRDELSFLRNCALEHVAGGCRNHRLLSYNQMKAEEAARSAQIGRPMHSPSLDDLAVMTGMGNVASPGHNAGSSGEFSRRQSHDRRASLHQLHSQAFGTGSGQQQQDQQEQQQTMSPMSDMDHSMYDFARPTTQQSLANLYSSTGNDENFGVEATSG